MVAWSTDGWIRWLEVGAGVLLAYLVLIVLLWPRAASRMSLPEQTEREDEENG